MSQSYKIFINGTPLYLTEKGGAAALGLSASKTVVTGHYNGSKKWLFPYIHLPESTENYDAIVLESNDLPQLWADFQTLFKVVEAAGGYVENAAGELLLIFRRGSWDLPKGKIDPGESHSEAALREVTEETGIQNLELGQFLTTTFHTYEHKGKRVLKPTYWYKMRTSDTTLIPQTEEDIEQAIWEKADDFLAKKPVVYASLMDVILMGMNTK